MAVSIKKISTKDVKKLEKLLLKTFDFLSDRYYSKESMKAQKIIYTEENLTKGLALDNHFSFGLFDKNNLIGFIFGSFHKITNLAYVDWLGVDEKWMKKGLLKRLLSKVETEAKKRKFHKVFFYTSRKNIPAVKGYLKNNYLIEGVLDKHYWGMDFLFFGKVLINKKISGKYSTYPDFEVK